MSADVCTGRVATAGDFGLETYPPTVAAAQREFIAELHGVIADVEAGKLRIAAICVQPERGAHAARLAVYFLPEQT
jgi:hypothetical protein